MGKYKLDHWTLGRLDYFIGLFFWTIFGPFYRGGGGGRPLVLKEGWDAVYQYSGRGEKQTVVTGGRGGRRTIRVGGGCI